ncbi:histidine kinase [Paraglaciecola sp.]|uniref:sensor histidine kinase n=1 Tax=Paraglaciecola sp. TaxID=1920173 RepID=UPI0030F37EE8
MDRKFKMKSNPSSTLFWLLQIGGWGCFTLLNIVVRVQLNGRLSTEIITSTVLGLALLLSSSLLRQMHKKYLGKEGNASTVIRIIVGSLFAALLTCLLLLAVIYPNQELIFAQKIDDLPLMLALNLPTLWLLLLFWSAIYVAIARQRQLKREQQSKALLNKSLQSAELDLLMNQINPHFVFNALNNIRALVLEDTERARDAITSLSDVLRNTMQQDTKLVLFQDELVVVEQYLALNTLQFEQRLQIEWHIDDVTLGLQIPRMVLQLLVENAIKHGIAKLRDGGVIIIRSYIEGETWFVEVCNPFSASSEQSTKISSASENGIGISNINKRLALLYGNEATFRLEHQHQQVHAILRLPTNTQGAIYPKSFELHGGDKRMRPHGLSSLRDWGE